MLPRLEHLASAFVFLSFCCSSISLRSVLRLFDEIQTLLTLALSYPPCNVSDCAPQRLQITRSPKPLLTTRPPNSPFHAGLGVSTTRMLLNIREAAERTDYSIYLGTSPPARGRRDRSDGKRKSE